MTTAGAALTVGDRVPDLPLVIDDGRGFPLSAFWSARPIALVFLGPLDSDLSVDHAIQLRDGHNNMRLAGGEIVAVCAEPPADATAFRERWHLPYRLVCDVAGRAYVQFGVTFDYPGTFLIDAAGVVRYAHRNRGALDNPSTWSLVQVACVLTGNVVEPPAPILVEGNGDAHNGSALDGQVKLKYTCAKCGSTDYEVLEVDLRRRRFSAVSCQRCTHTEFYRADSPALRSVFGLIQNS